jgi:hypothetical protein
VAMIVLLCVVDALHAVSRVDQRWARSRHGL